MDPLLAVATSGIARFACLGDRCEDTCCRTWSISIDEPHYHSLGDRMRAAGEGGQFEAAFALRPDGDRTQSAFARVRLRVADDCCPLLSPERLCTVHARWGEEALPDVCAAYPRLGRIVGDRFEVHGSLSCPEVARRSLIDDGGADLIEVDRASLGRVPVAD